MEQSESFRISCWHCFRMSLLTASWLSKALVRMYTPSMILMSRGFPSPAAPPTRSPTRSLAPTPVALTRDLPKSTRPWIVMSHSWLLETMSSTRDSKDWPS